MIIGGMVGIGNEATFVIEKIIAASVIVIGLLTAFNKKINAFLLIIALSIFGFFHGFAHGAEMPPAMSSTVYISGYSLGALLMGIIGMLIGRFISSIDPIDRNTLFVSGVLVGSGIMILVN